MIKVSIITIAKEIKEIHPTHIALIRCGTFYKVYGKDAYIIANIFKYAIKEEQGVTTCGFPINSIKKVETQLENKKVNYLVIDRRDNYSVNEKVEFKNLNSYEKEFEMSKVYVKNTRRVETINKYLQENINNENLKDILKDIESVINAKRKI